MRGLDRRAGERSGTTEDLASIKRPSERQTKRNPLLHYSCTGGKYHPVPMINMPLKPLWCKLIFQTFLTLPLSPACPQSRHPIFRKRQSNTFLLHKKTYTDTGKTSHNPLHRSLFKILCRHSDGKYRGKAERRVPLCRLCFSFRSHCLPDCFAQPRTAALTDGR